MPVSALMPPSSVKAALMSRVSRSTPRMPKRDWDWMPSAISLVFGPFDGLV